LRFAAGEQPEMRHRFGRIGARAAALLLVLVAAGCVPATTLPSNCGEAEVSFSATLSDSRMQPAQFDVCRDQQVTIKVDSHVAGDLHFHGYDTEVPEQPVTAGQTVTVTFAASHPGQFQIELHPEDGSEERAVALLVVHER